MSDALAACIGAAGRVTGRLVGTRVVTIQVNGARYRSVAGANITHRPSHIRQTA